MKKNVWHTWKVGTLDNDNELIKYIIGGGEGFPFIVYFVESNNLSWLKWNFDRKEVKHAHTIEAIAHKYLFLAKKNLSNDELGIFKDNLAGCIVNAFNESHYQNVTSSKRGFKNCFETVDNFLQSKDPAYIYGRYIFYASLSMIFFILLGLLLLYIFNNSIIIYGAIAGCVGAYISILQRFNKMNKTSLEIYKIAHYYILSIEAITRIIIGCTFGALALIIHESNIISLFNIKNNYSAILLGFISGISERFIPSLIDIIKKQTNNIT